ncbi:MAG TPA: hypothetical protein VGK89_02335 [Candidatus Eisenbacteria bacterium]
MTTSTLRPGARSLRGPTALARLGERLSSILVAAIEPCRIPTPAPIPVRRPRPIARSLAASAALAFGVAFAVAPAARASDAWESTDDGRLVSVEVLVDGSSAPLFMGPGSWDKRYFQAFRGRNYALAVTNRTGERVGVLISVDGLNVVNGERSHLAGTEAMYVLGPWERAVIRGWRTSLQDVRRFVFVDEERSYAERTGQANGDMGWIRVLSFREQRPQVWIEPRFREDDEHSYRGGKPLSQGEERSAPAPAPKEQGQASRDAKDGIAKPRAEAYNREPAPESNPGTGWGEHRWDPVQRTQFLAASHETDHLILRYEYESGLRALGIFPRRGRTWWRERGELGWGFAQPPRW